MHYNDHYPAHFHAIYADQDVQVNIETLEFMRGRLPQRAAHLVLEWAALHQEELADNWRLRSQAQRVKPIAPLE
jgi:hypothetical protein